MVSYKVTTGGDLLNNTGEGLLGEHEDSDLLEQYAGEGLLDGVQRVQEQPVFIETTSRSAGVGERGGVCELFKISLKNFEHKLGDR